MDQESIKSRFTRKKIVNFIINELMGRFIGFAVGMWTAKLFTHQVYEKKKFIHMIGLAKRKKIIVNDTPEWVQWMVSAIIGFIVLELISHFFENKVYLHIWNFVKKQFFKKGYAPDGLKAGDLEEN